MRTGLVPVPTSQAVSARVSVKSDEGFIVAEMVVNFVRTFSKSCGKVLPNKSQ